MSASTDLPFERGKTYFGSSTPAIDTASTEFEGREYTHLDIIKTPGSTFGQLRSSNPVTVKIVRNTSTIALAPKRAVKFQDGYFCKRVDGYNTTDMGVCALVDEYLPAAGAAINDLFYVVVDGPATGKSTAAANGLFNIFTYGGKVFGLSAAASTGATAGRLRILSTFAEGANETATNFEPVYRAAANVLGHAQTTQGVSTHSDVDVLVHVKRMF